MRGNNCLVQPMFGPTLNEAFVESGDLLKCNIRTRTELGGFGVCASTLVTWFHVIVTCHLVSRAFVCQEELVTWFHVIVNLLFVRFAITTFILQHYEGKTNFLELCTVTDSKQLKQILSN